VRATSGVRPGAESMAAILSRRRPASGREHFRRFARCGARIRPLSSRGERVMCGCPSGAGIGNRLSAQQERARRRRRSRSSRELRAGSSAGERDVSAGTPWLRSPDQLPPSRRSAGWVPPRTSLSSTSARGGGDGVRCADAGQRQGRARSRARIGGAADLAGTAQAPESCAKIQVVRPGSGFAIRVRLSRHPELTATYVGG